MPFGCGRLALGPTPHWGGQSDAPVRVCALVVLAPLVSEICAHAECSFLRVGGLRRPLHASMAHHNFFFGSVDLSTVTELCEG